MKMRKILLVDDDKCMLDSLARILDRDNYELTKCENAVDAWRFVNSKKGELDLIISDNKMPNKAGTDLLVAMRKRYPNIVRIMLTGQSDVDDAKKAINEGEVYRFLTKPIDPYEIELIVKHALAHKDLWLDNQRLSEKIKKQETAIDSLEKEHSGISKMNRDEKGRIIIDETDYQETLDDFMKQYFK